MGVLLDQKLVALAQQGQREARPQGSAQAHSPGVGPRRRQLRLRDGYASVGANGRRHSLREELWEGQKRVSLALQIAHALRIDGSRKLVRAQTLSTTSAFVSLDATRSPLARHEDSSCPRENLERSWALASGPAQAANHTSMYVSRSAR